MEYLQIYGGKRLEGTLNIHGAKNSILPILAATVLVDGTSIIHNCPDISDVSVTLDILRHLGADIKVEGDTVIVDSTQLSDCHIPEDMMQELRSSIIFLGSLASRTGNACVFLPGGCDIGLRPIDLHIKGLKALGYKISCDDNNICCTAEKAVGAKIVLPFPSVGATENIILASVLAKGTTTVINAAKEPEIADLADFLNSAGADIKGASTAVIEINGVDRLKSTAFTVMPDRILASTMMAACTAVGGDIVLRDVRPSHTMPTLPVFDEMGASIYVDKSSLRIATKKRPRRVRTVETQPYPGFPTDAQAPVMAALSVARGTSLIKENIFENRFRHVPQLQYFGADITVHDKFAVVNGVRELHSATARCTDLRGGAAVVIAALTAKGVSKIYDLHHIDRGYEHIESQLSALGADIKRINDEKERTQQP